MRYGIALAALALLAALVFFFRPTAATPDVVAAEPDVPRAASERPAAELDAPAAPEPERRVAGTVPEAARALAPAAEETATDPSTLHVEGRVVLVEDSGEEVEDASGSMTLILWQGNHGGHRQVAVERGAWTLELEEPCALGVRELELDGRAAIPEDPRARHAIDRGVVVVRARLPVLLVLHVRDAATGVPLSPVTVAAVSWGRAGAAHPGGVDDAEEVIDGATSPIDLRLPAPYALRDEVTLFAHAPGYAWGSVRVDPRAGGERFLDLVPGGGMDVAIHGDLTGRTSRLRVREGHEDAPVPLVDIEVGGRDDARIEGLVPGAYRVSLEVGEWFRGPASLASASAEVRPGERTPVELVVDALPLPPKVPLAGVVVVPPAWELSDFVLTLEVLGAPLDGGDDRKELPSVRMSPVPEEEGALAWTAGDVLPGRYELALGQLEYSISFEVGPGGRSDVRFEVPPPGTVSVEVVDTDTGERAEIEHISWACRRPQWVTTGGLENVGPDPETGRFEFRAPQCEIMVSTTGGGYGWANASVDVGPGTNEVRLEVRRTIAITLCLRDGETPVPWPSDFRLRPEALDGGAGRGVTWTTRNGRRSVDVDLPGRYCFEMPAIAGYEAIPPQVVEVLAGQRTLEHVVQLVRQP